jgi:copper ion binding protein
MKTIQLSVGGMSCGHCVATVESALTVVQGVHSVAVDLGAGRATVQADDAVNEKALVQAVERSGYQAAAAR